MRFAPHTILAALLLLFCGPAAAAYNSYGLAAPSTLSNQTPYPQLPFAPPSMYGVTGNGTTDDTAAFQAILTAASGKAIIEVPKGTYKITSGLTLPSNTQIECAKGAQFNSDYSSATGFYLFTATSVTNIRISGCTFNNTTTIANANDVPVYIVSSTNVMVDHNTTIGVGLLSSTNIGGYGAGLNSSNIFSEFNNIGVGASAGTIGSTTGIFGIIFQYTTYFHSIGDTANGLEEGIGWWGGDANVNGAIGNDREVSQGSISGATVKGIGGGCIWGSMGQNITIQNSTALGCGDVGFDNEGGVDVQFVGGTVSNCLSGCLTTFFYVTDALFEGVTVSQPIATQPMAHINNANLTQDARTSVTFEGDIFDCTAATPCPISDSGGPIGLIKFSGNTLRNTYLSFINKDNNIQITDNDILLTEAFGSSASVLSVGPVVNDSEYGSFGTIHVSGNKIISAVAQPSGTTALAVRLYDPNENSSAVLSDNYIQNFTVDLTITCCGANATNGNFTINNNTLMDGTYTTTIIGGSGENPTVILTGNRDFNNCPFPGAVVSGTYYSVGQIFYACAPTSSSYIGKVQTVAGATGTQDNWGATQ